MYAFANVKMFVDDNQEKIGDQAEAILKRAEELSERGVISGSAIPKIFNNTALAEEFETAVQNDLEHIKIGLRAIEAAR
jgi:hypothetical protein